MRCPVYYIDLNGDNQELGRERKRRPAPAIVHEPVRKAVGVQRRVYGPNATLQLEEGEWELVDTIEYVVVAA